MERLSSGAGWSYEGLTTRVPQPVNLLPTSWTDPVYGGGRLPDVLLIVTAPEIVLLSSSTASLFEESETLPEMVLPEQPPPEGPPIVIRAVAPVTLVLPVSFDPQIWKATGPVAAMEPDRAASSATRPPPVWIVTAAVTLEPGPRQRISPDGTMVDFVIFTAAQSALVYVN
jgi:hypothetical protein